MGICMIARRLFGFVITYEIPLQTKLIPGIIRFTIIPVPRFELFHRNGIEIVYKTAVCVSLLLRFEKRK